MSNNNPTPGQALKNSHANWMAGSAWDIDNPLIRLRVAASSCFFGEPMYYHRDSKKELSTKLRPTKRLTEEQLTYLRSTLNAMDPVEWRGLSPKEMMERAIDDALGYDPEGTLREAARLRREENIRTTPQVILVRAANIASVKGTGLVRHYGREIISRADEPAVGLAYQLECFGKPIPNSLKKAWKDALERASAYQLAKYRLKNRRIKTVDVINVTHPKGEAISKLVKGELKATGMNWEAILSEEGSTTAAWLKAIEVMGHMALLRNLGNLIKAGVPTDLYLDRLVGGAETGNQLPFRYFSAWRAIRKKAPGVVKEALERCLEISVSNLPQLRGRVMSLCDNSGSAWGTMTSKMGSMQIANIANLSAVLTAKNSEEGHVGVFGDRLETFQIKQERSTLAQLEHSNRLGNRIGGGTENGIWLFWEKAIEAREHWDSVFVYSDMQAGHGGLFGLNRGDYEAYLWGHKNIDIAKLITTYRHKVNPHVDVFLVQVAGYQDTIVPEFYDRTYILGGWGEGLLRFAASMQQHRR